MAIGEDLRSTRFRAEREKTWRTLEHLVERVERRGIRSLKHEELAALPRLYRQTLSGLNVARSISLDRNLREYLEVLSTRAYLCVYGPQRSVLQVLGRVLTRDFPRAFRNALPYVGLSASFMFGGAVVAFILCYSDLEWYDGFTGGMAQGRTPESSVEELREGLYGGEDGPLAAFAAHLFSHNSQVAILCFSLGFILGIPTAILLFYNGLVLGAFTALYHRRGLGVDVWGWLLPHGVTELSAIIIAGGAGLMLGGAVLAPGRFTRADNLRRRGKEVGPIVMGAVIMLFAAALLEGFFRQLVHSVPVRYVAATLSAAVLFLYFSQVGREPDS